MPSQRLLDDVPLGIVHRHAGKIGGAARCTRPETEVVARYVAGARHEHCAFHRVLQLADVARPAMRLHGGGGLVVEAMERLAISRRVVAEEVGGESRDIVSARYRK